MPFLEHPDQSAWPGIASGRTACSSFNAVHPKKHPIRKSVAPDNVQTTTDLMCGKTDSDSQVRLDPPNRLIQECLHAGLASSRVSRPAPVAEAGP